MITDMVGVKVLEGSIVAYPGGGKKKSIELGRVVSMAPAFLRILGLDTNRIVSRVPAQCLVHQVTWRIAA